MSNKIPTSVVVLAGLLTFFVCGGVAYKMLQPGQTGVPLTNNERQWMQETAIRVNGNYNLLTSEEKKRADSLSGGRGQFAIMAAAKQ